MQKFSDLEKKADKIGGKNTGTLDGFYTDKTTSEKYFIKVPGDPKELFTELFAGKLIEKFKKYALIPAEDHESLICADCIEVDPGKYGLIQPMIEFTELFNHIGSKANYGPGAGDRSVFYETLYGPQIYAKISKDGTPSGLAFAVMMVVALGNNSVHSGNVVILKNKPTRYALIDFGASLRDYGHADNGCIESPRECQGLFNPKAYTKNYLQNYRLIPGFFADMSLHAQTFLEKMTAQKDLLNKLVAEVLSEIPNNLLGPSQRRELSVYTSLPCDDICQNAKGNQAFVASFCDFMQQRLDLIVKLSASSIDDSARECKSETTQDFTRSSIHAADDEEVLNQGYEIINYEEVVDGELDDKKNIPFLLHLNDRLKTAENSKLLGEISALDQMMAPVELSQPSNEELPQEAKSNALIEPPLLKGGLVIEFNTEQNPVDLDAEEIKKIHGLISDYTINRNQNTIGQLTTSHDLLLKEFKACGPVSSLQVQEQVEQITSDFAKIDNTYKILLDILQKPSIRKLRSYKGKPTLFTDPVPYCIENLNSNFDWLCEKYKSLLDRENLYQDLSDLNAEQLNKFIAMPKLVELIQLLYDFRKEHLNKPNMSQDYIDSINSFYADSKHIILDQKNNSIDNVVKKIKEKAHEHFKHRHLRVLLDFLLIISTLAIITGGVRVALGKSFFFSTASTNREDKIDTLLEIIVSNVTEHKHPF